MPLITISEIRQIIGQLGIHPFLQRVIEVLEAGSDIRTVQDLSGGAGVQPP